jgi:biopolymer transport protein ExbB
LSAVPEIDAALRALRAGGPFVYPLFFLAVVAVALVLDRAYVYWRLARVPVELVTRIETYGFDWAALERDLAAISAGNYLRRFVAVVVDGRAHPAWWVESRAADEASLIEASLARGLWALETIVTAAPLLGLLGTISGMIGAFRLFGAGGLVDPGAVTGGVAEALIATAVGIVIALIALFAYNFFSRLQARVMDEMERLGTRVVDRIRLDQGGTP